MSELPPPSDTPRVFLHVGLFSGLDVLTVGIVAPAAKVELNDRSTGEVVAVKRWRRPKRAEIRLDDGRIVTARAREVRVLREAPQPPAAQSKGSGAVVVSDAARPPGV